MSSDGTDVRRLTYEGNYNDSAAWSPTGDRIAFASRVDGVFRICVIGVVGGPIYPLTGGAGSQESPCWAPDGRHIAYISTEGGRSSLYVMNADGTNNRRVSTSPGRLYSPTWSPPLTSSLVVGLEDQTP